MTVSTVVLSILTSIYVWITHRLLKETVDANNHFKNVSGKQLYSEVMPQLYASFEIVGDRINLVLTNTGNNACYDLEIHIFGVYDEKRINISQFIVDYVSENDRAKCSEVTTYNGSFSVWDYTNINIFMGGKGKKLPVYFFGRPGHCQVFFQFKDRLGNNYSQTFSYFLRDNSSEPIMDLLDVMPSVMEPTKQIYLGTFMKEAKNNAEVLETCPSHIQELLIYGNHSIKSSLLNNRPNSNIEERGCWFDL
ncbi:hypothetical protein [Vibrio cholerae]|uniref:hypothetical protein n=1 Tax=Vibrio cholerae TaxID=666 RepID=UPI000D39443E|nr:hypothetical protein [Vibrio cholerae]TYW33319.1 hypothetical protein FY552_18320 [Vibrio cholerae]